SVILSGAPAPSFRLSQLIGAESKDPVNTYATNAASRHSHETSSRELPDAAWPEAAPSGSFDSPSSRPAGLVLAQDDSGIFPRLPTNSFGPIAERQFGLLIQHQGASKAVGSAGARNIHPHRKHARHLLLQVEDVGRGLLRLVTPFVLEAIFL